MCDRSLCQRCMRCGIVTLAVVAVTGWRPWSREYIPPQNLVGTCSCLGVAAESRAAETVLRRSELLPAALTKPEVGCGAAERTLAPSAAALALHAHLNLGAPSFTILSSTCPRLISPVWMGKERGALGPLLHSLVPVVWAAQLSPASIHMNGTALHVLSPKLRSFAHHEECKGQSLDCFLQPLSPRIRPAGCHSRGSGVVEDLGVTEANRHTGNLTHVLRLRRDLTVPRTFDYSRGFEAALPDGYADRGLFWLASHTLAHLLRPSTQLAARLASQRRALGLPAASARTGGESDGEGAEGGRRTSWTLLQSGSIFGWLLRSGAHQPPTRGSRGGAAAARAAEASTPVLAVHLRHSEPCRPHHVFGRRRTCDQLAAYVPPVRRMVELYGYKTALVVSESEGVLANATAAFAPLRVVTYLEARPPHADGYEASMSYLSAAHLMGACDGFVGKFSSSLGRLAYSLMATRGGVDCLRPYVSLDQPWCIGLGCRKEGRIRHACRCGPSTIMCMRA